MVVLRWQQGSGMISMKGEWIVKEYWSAKAKSRGALRAMARSLALVLSRAAKNGSASGRRVMGPVLCMKKI